MKIKNVIFLIFFGVLCISAETRQSTDAFENVKQGIRQYLTTGVKTTAIENALRAYQLPHIFRRNIKNVFDNVEFCTLCNLVVDLMIGERMLGLSRETFVEEAEFLCVNLGIENERVCHGVVDIHVDIFLYIFDNYPNLTSNRVCGSYFQSRDCPTGGDFDWTIDIPTRNENPKTVMDHKQSKENSKFSILHLSDIHYDPIYKPKGNANCGEPICCQEDQGEPATEEDACGYWSDYRSADSPWHLIEETARHAKTQDFQYVYYTGDIIFHRVWATSIENNTNDIEKIYSFFKDNFDVPVYPVFGNHEPHPVNAWGSEGVEDEKLSAKWLFELAADYWSELVGEDISETVLKGGYYTVTPRSGFRIIGININLCSVENWWLIYDDVDPFGQLQWLADTLKQAEDNNEKVHILAHAPSSSSACLKACSREYKRIIERFSDTITGQFNGDTHKDELHVFYDSNNDTEAVSVAFNGASVTPFGFSNPSYKLYFVDDTDFSLQDYEEWTFNLTLANSKPSSELPEWYKLYTFTEAYNVTNLTPPEVNKVLYAMTEDNSLLDKYFRFYHRNGDPSIKDGCDANCQKGFLCNMARSQYGDDTQCNYFSNLYDERHKNVY